MPKRKAQRRLMTSILSESRNRADVFRDAERGEYAKTLQASVFGWMRILLRTCRVSVWSAAYIVQSPVQGKKMVEAGR